jgi:hypothetical protein
MGAVFNRALSDGELETIIDATSQINNLVPIALMDEDLATDLTGGGSDEVTHSGTTLVDDTGLDALWTPGLAPPLEEHEGSVAIDGTGSTAVEGLKVGAGVVSSSGTGSLAATGAKVGIGSIATVLSGSVAAAGGPKLPYTYDDIAGAEYAGAGEATYG